MQKPAALFLSKNQQVFGNTASLLQIKVNKGRQALPYSPKAAEKAGFVREGLSRRYLNINGVWEDHIHMVRLNEDAL